MIDVVVIMHAVHGWCRWTNEQIIHRALMIRALRRNEIVAIW